MPESIYQIEIRLNNVSKPPVWREVQVPADLTLSDLHAVIQTSMGWFTSHLHQFYVDRRGDHYGPPSPWGDDFLEDYTGMRMDQFLQGPGDKLLYEYDFGDGWEHTIKLKKILVPEDGMKYPRCLKSKGACPPEDCGGPWGFDEFKAAMANKKHSQHRDMVEWYGAQYDPMDSPSAAQITKELQSENFGMLDLGL